MKNSRLCNKRLDDLSSDLDESFGPYACVGDGQFKFEARSFEHPIWLGYNASPLFGLAHWSNVWSEDATSVESAEFKRLKTAWHWLMGRTRRSLAGQLPLKPAAELEPFELIYNYICLSVLDQFADAHQAIFDSIVENLGALVREFDALISNVDSEPARFEFEFAIKDVGQAKLFSQRLEMAGILHGPASSGKAPVEASAFRFQLNMAYRGLASELFWQRLRLALASLEQSDVEFDSPQISIPDDLRERADFHRAVVAAKAGLQLSESFSPQVFLQRQLDSLGQELKCVIVNRENYSDYRQQILDMQVKVYEPVRRTPAAEFDMLFESENPLAIVALDENEIVAMAFAGRLGLFGEERGVSDDPFVEDRSTSYSVDLTVVPEFRGGLGRKMKQAMVLLAIENGVTAIHGRNRDRLAAGMWAINISLGGYQLQNLVNDYPDEGEFRDCIYYRCPLTWDRVFPKAEAARIKDSLVARCNGQW